MHYTAGWEALLVWDTVILILTLAKTYKGSRRSSILGRSSIVAVMFRDGAIYFAVMVFANLGNVVAYYIAPPLLKDSLVPLASSISVTVMSRLMLNLHKAANSGVMSNTAAVSQMMDFASASTFMGTENLDVEESIELGPSPITEVVP